MRGDNQINRFGSDGAGDRRLVLAALAAPPCPSSGLIPRSHAALRRVCPDAAEPAAVKPAEVSAAAVRTPQTTPGVISDESDVDGLVLRDHVERDDDRVITGLSADLAWQLAGVVISPMVMSVDEFETWKARERATPLAIEREGIAL